MGLLELGADRRLCIVAQDHVARVDKILPHGAATNEFVLNAASIAAWLSRADRDGSLAAFLNPDLSPPERALTQVEGWMSGVPGAGVGKSRRMSTG